MMTSERPSDIELSLVAPTYNEKENIAHLVERVHKSLSQYNYEIIVVDDNSPDGTSEVVKALSSRYPLNVIVRTKERGLASAVVAGFREAKGRVMGVIDADLQHPPEAIPSLIESIRSGADIAIGSRYVEGGGIEGWDISRKIISRGATAIARISLASARKTKDPLSGFFLFRREVINNVVLAPKGYKILLEVLVRGKATNVSEIPYTFKERERGQSNLTLREQLNYLEHVILLAWFEGGIKRFIKFCIVGGSGTGVYLGLLALFTESAGLFYALSAAIAYEISILNNFTWNEIWTFRDKRATAKGSVLIRAVKFNLVSLVGLGIHEAVLTFFTEVVDLFYILSAIIAILFAMLWNFFANVKWTWSAREAATSSDESQQDK